ncbi:MAG TPA: DUF4424 family protein [Rhizomicrobium sp.]|jgi:hypothetical protein|nr:DUF4424 family protein [Rhizomicrobium sp.]
MKRLSLALGTAVCLAAPSFADDGSAELGAGGIVFTKSADISMAREDLYLSPQKVRVRFEFRNTGADQDVTIAFPLPDLDIENFQSSEIGTVGDDPLNFVGFTATVNGKAVAFQSEQKAFIAGKDVSAQIRAAGLPLNLTAKGGYDLLDKLPEATRKTLVKDGIVDYEDNHVEPLWTVRTRFYWHQHFAAGKTVVIAHSYAPVTGGSQYYDSKDAPVSQEGWVEPFCLSKSDIGFLKTMLDHPNLRQPLQDGLTEGMLLGEVTDYVLKTANTWKGPIGHFHLTLDKLDARRALMLCWRGDLKKTGPTTFEFSADNFTPTQDIHMAVLR